MYAKLAVPDPVPSNRYALIKSPALVALHQATPIIATYKSCFTSISLDVGVATRQVMGIASRTTNALLMAGGSESKA